MSCFQQELKHCNPDSSRPHSGFYANLEKLSKHQISVAILAMKSMIKDGLQWVYIAHNRKNCCEARRSQISGTVLIRVLA